MVFVLVGSIVMISNIEKSLEKNLIRASGAVAGYEREVWARVERRSYPLL